MKIGWVGTGIMGAAMCTRLLERGYDCTVFNRTREKAEPLLALGARWADSPAEVARNSDVVFAMVGFPADVESVFLNPQSGILAGFGECGENGKIAVDMTTSKPSLARKIWEVGCSKNIQTLDAPVSGGDIGAKNGTLSIMVGGDRPAFDQLRPIWEILGKTTVFQGPSGAGQHTKMMNQILIAGNMLGVCEALRYARSVGLDAETALSSVSGGAAGSWSLSNLAPRILCGDFAPGFKITHFVKDLRIALEEADAEHLNLPGLQLAKQLYEQLELTGHGQDGTQALAEM